MDNHLLHTIINYRNCKVLHSAKMQTMHQSSDFNLKFHKFSTYSPPQNRPIPHSETASTAPLHVTCLISLAVWLVVLEYFTFISA